MALRANKSQPRRWIPVTLGFTLVAWLGACASPDGPDLSRAGSAWRINDKALAAAQQNGLELKEGKEVAFQVSPSAAASLQQAATSTRRASNVEADLVVLNSPKLNAYTYSQAGRPAVVLTTKTIDQFGSDPATLAFLLAHETAHHTLGHVQAGLAAQDAQGTERLPSMELDADRQALLWLAPTSLGPCGAVAFLNALNNAPFFARPLVSSTHPSPSQRLAAASAVLNSFGLDCGASSDAR